MTGAAIGLPAMAESASCNFGLTDSIRFVTTTRQAFIQSKISQIEEPVI